MTNQSIKNAFQRFWEYVVSKVDGKQDIITGTPGKFVVIGEDGNVTVETIPYSAKLDAYAPTAFIISTSTTNLPTVVDGAILVAYDA